MMRKIVFRDFQKGDLQIRLFRAWDDENYLNQKMETYENNELKSKTQWIQLQYKYLRKDLRGTKKEEEILYMELLPEVENLIRDGWTETKIEIKELTIEEKADKLADEQLNNVLKSRHTPRELLRDEEWQNEYFRKVRIKILKKLDKEEKLKRE